MEEFFGNFPKRRKRRHSLIHISEEWRSDYQECFRIFQNKSVSEFQKNNNNLWAFSCEFQRISFLGEGVGEEEEEQDEVRQASRIFFRGIKTLS